jgi:DNA-directed RNA polymerase specialized sigma24 family protein
MHDDASGGSNQGRDPEDLTRLLSRLDPDMTRAWERYADIRLRLTKFFEWNHCTGPEDLADEVLDRVAAKPNSEEIRKVETYSCGVARFVCLEVQRKKQHVIYSEDLLGGEDGLPDAHDQPAEIVERLDEEKRLACLRQCLAALTPEDGELAIQYYSAEEQKQMNLRRELARKAGLTLGALRVHMNRLRAKLEPCVKGCLESRR